jgi:hypothetical protein
VSSPWRRGGGGRWRLGVVVARARGQQGRGKRSGQGGDDAWARAGAGGGAWGVAPAVSGGGRSGTEVEAAVTEEEEAAGVSGTCLQFPKSSGTSR